MKTWLGSQDTKRVACAIHHSNREAQHGRSENVFLDLPALRCTPRENTCASNRQQQTRKGEHGINPIIRHHKLTASLGRPCTSPPTATANQNELKFGSGGRIFRAIPPVCDADAEGMWQAVRILTMASRTVLISKMEKRTTFQAP